MKGIAGYADESLAKEIEKLRILQAFCSHDLRTLVGTSLTSLEFATDSIKELPNYQDFETELQFLTSAFEQTQSALEAIDSKVMRCTPESVFFWYCFPQECSLNVSIEKIKNPLIRPLFIEGFHDIGMLLQKLEDYRPAGIVIHAQGVMPKYTFDELTKIIGPSRTPIALLGAESFIKEEEAIQCGYTCCFEKSDTNLFEKAMEAVLLKNQSMYNLSNEDKGAA